MSLVNDNNNDNESTSSEENMEEQGKPKTKKKPVMLCFHFQEDGEQVDRVVDRDLPMADVKQWCARRVAKPGETIQLDPDSFRLYFDGNRIRDDDTYEKLHATLGLTEHSFIDVMREQTGGFIVFVDA
jgi:hypothetical protein